MSALDHLEPAAKTVPNVNGDAVRISIAISLKRIADAIDGTTLGVDITESLAGIGRKA